MTTQVIDRNAAFAAERKQQIDAVLAFNAGIPARAEAAREAAAQMRADFQARVDAGKVRDNGDGTYTVTDPGSWDNGEVWRMQQPRGMEMEQPLAMPESNLDMSTGSAALYTRVPEWHVLGNVIPAGISDLPDVLVAGGIAWTVAQAPASFTAPDGRLIEVPGSFVNYREDTMAPLGVVGKIYNPFQNAVAGAFLQDLVNRYNIVFESAGATYGGKHVFIGMRLPDDVIIELPDGVRDTIIPYLYFLNSHDGTTSASVTVSPWRVACGNTERFNLRDAVARWSTRHTTNALEDERLAEARRTLGLSVKYFTEFKEEMEQFARIEMELAQFEGIVADIFTKPEDDASKTKAKNWDERIETMQGMWKVQAAETGKNLYTAERVFTDYLDHAAPKRVTGDKLAAARATALIDPAAVEGRVKNKVHARLLTLAS